MYEFIEGNIEQINPAFVVLNVNGIGYHILISMNTFEHVKSLKQVRLLMHMAIKEDAHTLHGFFDSTERELFRYLITVNGVGTNTARMILSGQSLSSIISAISNGNISLLKSVKGVGPKTAQRIIIELQDKVGRIGSGMGIESLGRIPGKSFDEALEALLALGFPRNASEKTLGKIAETQAGISVEEIIKQALKLL
ncbi:MAG: Holliday junction branch migration protein RuvA [Bacteroidia bacterium]|nr:Holliday junction branch migration protein RuvA [Bacteroidia bacterium]